MKKLLGLVMVLALVVPAKADILKNVKSYGEIQVIGNNVSNFPDSNDNYANTTLRVLYGLNFDLTEDVKANLTLAYYNLWGQENFATSNHTGSSLQSYLNNIDLVEANVVLSNLFCCLEAKVGRQFYGNEDSAIIYFGPNHYNSEQLTYKQAMSLDAVNLSYAGEALSWNFIYSKVQEIATNADADTTLLGLDGTYTLNDSFKVQGYAYDFRNAQNFTVLDPFTGVPVNPLGAKYVGIYGAKGTFNADAFTFAAEYARNVGGESALDHDKGDMLKVDASLNAGSFTPRATIVRGNQFQSFGNYRPGLIIGQTMGNFGALNVFEDTFIANLGVDMKFASMDKFTFSVDGFSYQDRNLKDAASYEVDGWVKYAMNKNVELHAAVGGLHVNHEDNAYKGQIGMLVRF